MGLWNPDYCLAKAAECESRATRLYNQADRRALLDMAQRWFNQALQAPQPPAQRDLAD